MSSKNRGNDQGFAIHDIRLLAHLFDDILQRIQRGDCAIDLPSSMVGHDNTITAHLYSSAGILYRLYTLKAEWFPARNLLPRLDQLGDLLLRLRASMLYVIDPHGAGFIRLFLRVDTSCFKTFLENRVRETEIRAYAVVEGVLSRCCIVMAPG